MIDNYSSELDYYNHLLEAHLSKFQDCVIVLYLNCIHYLISYMLSCIQYVLIDFGWKLLYSIYTLFIFVRNIYNCIGAYFVCIPPVKDEWLFLKTIFCLWQSFCFYQLFLSNRPCGLHLCTSAYISTYALWPTHSKKCHLEHLCKEIISK